MLVLSRKPSEQLVIGEGENQIVVTLLSINGSKVRIGIEAPDNFVVDRAEIRRRKVRPEETET